MIKKLDKNTLRKQRHTRVRGKVSGTAERPRLNVYRSLNNISVQVIDDVKGFTLASASSADKDLVKAIAGKTKSEVATLVGEKIAKVCLEKKIKKVVFDRGGYLYIGRVKNLAEGARNGGLEF